MLPRLLPMLAVPAAPFDSPEYSFELKWDGIRALAAVDASGCQMWGRERADYKARYPEFDVLGRLPEGTLVDGELVSFDPHGRPDLPRLLRRHGLTDPWRIAQAKRWCPVRYVVFDLLYHAGRCLLHELLARRRELLAEIVARLQVPEVIFSAGVVGAGTALYAAALAQGQRYGQKPCIDVPAGPAFDCVTENQAKDSRREMTEGWPPGSGMCANANPGVDGFVDGSNGNFSERCAGWNSTK